MTSPVRHSLPSTQAHRWLKRAGVAWFAVACVGQVAFVVFILAFYGVRTAQGRYPAWNDKPLIDGYVAGDTPGNVMFITHTLLAAVVTLGGLAQLIPALRRRWPSAHRWTGRMFLSIAIVLAVGGLWLTWARGTALSQVSAIAISGNAVLILLFAAAAWRAAILRDFEAHQRWAMRAFLVVNGVWFLRVGMMAWVLANQGPRWMSGSLSGPADIALVFGCYLIPLAVLEIYTAAQRARAGALVWGAVALMGIATVVTALGVIGTVTFMWGPYLVGAR